MSPASDRPPRDAGFALLGAILALVVLSLLAAAGLLVTSAEVDVSARHRAAAEAQLRAEAGLHRVLAETVGLPVAYRVVTVPGGTAEVVAERLVRLGDGRSLYRLASRSTADGGELREVERLAVILPPLGPVPAAISAAGGVAGGGTAARVSGLDGASATGCLAPPGDAAGVSVPVDGATGLTAGTVEGLPPVRETNAPLAPATSDGPATVERLVALGAVDGSVVVVGDGARLDAAASGTGVLVSSGSVRLEDGFRWEGVVVTGGTLSVRGGPVVRGAVLAGLAAAADTLGSAVDVDLGDGSVEVAYDRCAVASAVLGAARLTPVTGTWREAF